MSSIKVPATLRSRSAPAIIDRRKDAGRAGLVAAACIAVANPTGVIAQTAQTTQGTQQPQPTTPVLPQLPSPPANASPPVSPAVTAPSNPAAEQLPALTVEAPAKKKPVAAVKPAQSPSQATAPAPAVSPPPAAAVAPLDATATGAPGANPYADPSAAYKVDRSAQTKLTEPLLDTPRSVTTISKEVLEDKGATSVRELARTTPGVTLGTGEGGNPFGDRLYIRGFDARNDAYINGIRDPGTPIRENFNTEQIEILKGPSATIGGRGTSGGAVNIVTKQPAGQDFTTVTTTLGTDNTRRGTVDVNKVINNELSVRVNGMWQNANVAGRDEVFDDRWGGALAAVWKPTQSFKLTVDYFHLNLDQLPDWGVPWDSVNHRPFTDTPGVKRSNYYGYAARDFQKGQQDIVTTGVEAKVFDNATLTSKLRYGFSTIDYIASAPEAVTRVGLDPANWTVQSRPKSRYQENEIVANQTDLTTKFHALGGNHTIVTGFEISREDILRDSYTGLASEAFNPPPGVPVGTLVVPLLNPNTASIGFSGSPTRSGNTADVLVDTKSAYILDTIKFSPQWIFTGGIRLDDYDLSYTQKNANGTTTRLARSDLLLNYNVGITYKPLPNGSIYAAYGTSSNPVGNELDGNGQSYGGISAGNQLLDPEQNTSLEFGTKWELFNRHIMATASVFQTDKDNARETKVGDNVNVYSSGSYRIRGVELGLGGNVTTALSLYGGAVWMDSETLKSINPADVGKRFANIAHESFNLLAKYKLTDWMSVGGQVTYRGQINGGTLAANGNFIREFWRFDANAEFQLNKTLSLQFQGINLTNELYYDALYRSGTPFVYVAPGRAGYVTLQAKF